MMIGLEEQNSRYEEMRQGLEHSAEQEDDPKPGPLGKLSLEVFFVDIASNVDSLANEMVEDLDLASMHLRKAFRREYTRSWKKFGVQSEEALLLHARQFLAERLKAKVKAMGTSVWTRLSKLHDPWKDSCMETPSENISEGLIISLKKKLSNIKNQKSKRWVS